MVTALGILAVWMALQYVVLPRLRVLLAKVALRRRAQLAFNTLVLDLTTTSTVIMLTKTTN